MNAKAADDDRRTSPSFVGGTALPLLTAHSALHSNIQTVQSSKGLEFRSVIFIGLLPCSLLTDHSALSYVGMTRATAKRIPHWPRSCLAGKLQP